MCVFGGRGWRRGKGRGGGGRGGGEGDYLTLYSVCWGETIIAFPFQVETQYGYNCEITVWFAFTGISWSRTAGADPTQQEHRLLHTDAFSTIIIVTQVIITNLIVFHGYLYIHTPFFVAVLLEPHPLAPLAPGAWRHGPAAPADMRHIARTCATLRAHAHNYQQN